MQVLLMEIDFVNDKYARFQVTCQIIIVVTTIIIIIDDHDHTVLYIHST